MVINMKEWIATQIETDRAKAFPVLTHAGIEMIGKRVLDAVTDGEVHAAAVLELSKKYPSIASTVIMDLTVEAEAFGSSIVFYDDENPTTTGRLVSDRESIENLIVPDISAARVSEYIKACELISKESSKAVVAGCIGPFSLAGRLYDMSEIMMALFLDPDSIKILLEKCTDFILKYCQALKSVGANAVMIAEPAAGLLPNDQCMEFSSVYIKRMVEVLQDDNFTVILHNCGNMGQCTDAMVATGAAALHFGNAVDMVETLKKVPSDILVMGNIDPVGVIKESSADYVYSFTMSLLESTQSYKNFILSTGCDVPPMVPMANIDSFYKAVNDFNERNG